MRINLNFLSIEFTILIRKELSQKTLKGVYSLCENGQHILLLDYDNLELQQIYAEIKSLQTNFSLSTFYIFETSPQHYYTVCLDKISIDEYEQIMRWTNCDPNFRKGYNYNRMNSFVFRTSPKSDTKKIKYLEKIQNLSPRIKSKAHKLFLETVYRAKIEDKNFDNSTRLFTCEYVTFIK